MKSAQLLDILGNANRRMIIQLLASRPYYVSELSDRLSLGPKAVLGHLDLLEQIGLIQGITSEQRRKYYSIKENVKLEVFVSPYSYMVETSTIIQSPSSEEEQFPAVPDLDQSMTNLREMNRYLFELEANRRKLAKEQLDIEGEMTDVMARCIDRIYEVAQNDLEIEIMLAILKKPQDRRSLSMELGLPEYYTEEHVQTLLERNVLNEKKHNNGQLLSLI